MTIVFVDLAAQHARVNTEIMEAVQSVLNSGQFILGDELTQFEEEFAAYCGTRHCVGVGSGTDAIHLALRALGVGTGDEVLTAANTFIATAYAISHTGATPVLVDIETHGSNIDVDLIEAAITPRTKAIVPVHLFGHPANMDAIREIARRRGLLIVEDACQAHGARYKGMRTGSLGNAGCFSFYPGKNMGALGDGGAVVTDDDDVADQIRTLRNCGQKYKNKHPVIGFNSRLDTLQAAILRIKLSHLDVWNQQRRDAAGFYCELMADLDIELPQTHPDAEHVFHLFVTEHEERDRLLAHLGQRGVSCGMHYPMAIHEQPAFQGVKTTPTGAPVATARARKIISLPISPDITSDDIQFVADAIRNHSRD